MSDVKKRLGSMRDRVPDELVVLRRRAAASADGTKLPGHIGGPNDALRHIIGAAELTRRYGPSAAFVILEVNELMGNRYDKQSDADEAMDHHNNAIGIELGRGAKSYEEIVERAKALVAEGIA